MFPSFKPGAFDDMNFDYVSKSWENGQVWHAWAGGKTGTPAAGMEIYLNSFNEWKHPYP